MPKLFNDAQAEVNKSGNLSLGFGGFDDGAADAAALYAKGDCEWNLLKDLVPVGGASITYANVRTAVGQYGLSVTAGAAVTPNIWTSIEFPLRRTATVTPSGGANPATAGHGYKIVDLILGYTVATLAATSVNVVATQEAPQSNNGARANTSTTPLGAVTYENPVGTVVASLPVATQANPYNCRIVFATPVFITLAQSLLTVEIQLSLPNTSVVTITDLIARGSMALY